MSTCVGSLGYSMVRLGCATLIAAALIVTSTIFVAPFAHAATLTKIGHRALDRLSQCIQNSPNLEVLLIIDESASLKQNDPENVRGDVLPAFVELLGRLSATPLGDRPRHVELAASSFAVNYREWIKWTRLDDETTPEIATRLRKGLAKRNNGAGTDYLDALEGSRETMKIGAERFAEGPPPCKLMMWFTDGILDVGTDEEDARARAKLCAKAGPVNGLRKDGVITVAVLLIDRARVAQESDDERRRIRKGAADLKAAAESESTGGKNRCGIPTASAAPGAYLEGDVSALARLITIIIDAAAGGAQKDPADPEHLLVEPGIAYFTLTADAPTGLSLRSPDGSTLQLGAGASPRAGSTVDASVRWIGTTAYLTVPVVPGGVGEWQLQRDSTAPISLFLFANLDLVLDDADLVAGESSSVRGTVRRADGGTLNLADFGSVDVAVKQTGSTGDSDVSVTLDKTAKSFSGDVTPSPDVTSVRLVATLEARTQKGLIFRVARTSVQPVTRLDYPQIEPANLTLGEVRKARDTVTGTLQVTGAQQGPSTVCLTGIRPASAISLSDLTITPSDRTCMELAPGQKSTIPVTARLDRATAQGAEGRGFIMVSRTRATDPEVGTTAEQTIDVPFSVDVLPVRPSPWLFAAILAAGFLIPILLMYAVQLLARRLALARLMTAHIPVALVPGASPARLMRTEPVDAPLISHQDLEYLPQHSGLVPVAMASGETLQARLSRNPFHSPYGEVVAPSGWLVLGGDKSRRRRDVQRWRIPLRPDKEAYLLVERSVLAQSTKPGEPVPGVLVILVAQDPDIKHAVGTAKTTSEQSAGAWAAAMAELRTTLEASDNRPDLVHSTADVRVESDWGKDLPMQPQDKTSNQTNRPRKGRQPKPPNPPIDQPGSSDPKNW